MNLPYNRLLFTVTIGQPCIGLNQSGTKPYAMSLGANIYIYIYIICTYGIFFCKSCCIDKDFSEIPKPWETQSLN